MRATTHRDLPAPEVHLDEDGDFGFDWDIRRDLTLTLFVGPSGNVGWAALIGDEKSHGHFQWPAWSVQLDSALGLLQRSIAPLPSEPTPALEGFLASLKEAIVSLKEPAERIAASDNTEELRTLWRGKAIAYDVILGLLQRVEVDSAAASPVSAVPPTPEDK